METTRAAHWSITINNPVEEDRQALKDHPTFVKKIVCQDEVGDNGTLHIQGYVQTTQVRFSAIKKWLPRAHIEVARNQKALLNYVQKDDTAVEGSQQQISNEYLSMDKALMKLAEQKDISQFEMDFDKYMSNPQKEIKREYWALVNKILVDQPRTVGLYTNPQLERAWINTRSVWITLFSKSKVLEEDGSQDQALHPPPSAQNAQDESPSSSPCE